MARLSVQQISGLAGATRALYEALSALVGQINGLLDAQPTGRTTLVAGTARVTLNRVTLGSLIIPWCETPGGTPGALSTPTGVTATGVPYRVNNKYFTIQSDSATDTSVVGWKIVG